MRWLWPAPLLLGGLGLLWLRGAPAVEAPCPRPLRGSLQALGLLGDPGLLLPGPYVELQRHVEMYAWDVEAEALRTRPLLRWTAEPLTTGELRARGVDQENPPMPLRSMVLDAERARLAGYRFSPRRTRLYALSPLQLSRALLAGDDRRRRIVQDGAGHWVYLQAPGATPESPQLGDVRVRYHAAQHGAPAALCGELHGDAVYPPSALWIQE